MPATETSNPPPPGATAEKVAWACLAAAAAGLAYTLAEYWGAKPAHADRLLVLIGAGWAASHLGPLWAAIPARGRPAIGLPLVALGAAAIPVGWDVQNQTGMMPGIVMWWEAAGLLVAAVGLVLTRHGWGRLRAAAFPLLFPLFALPVPNAVLGRMHPVLQDLTTTAAGAVFSVGLPVERIGFILRLPSGDIGVAEACDGVQSLTTLPAAAAFVAYLRGFGPARGLALMVLTVPLVSLANACRVVVTGLIQEAVGPGYIQGSWHEALGLVTVLAGVAGILAVARLLGRADESPPPPPLVNPPPPGRVWATRAAAVLLATSAALSAAAVSTAPSNRPPVELPFDDIPTTLPGGWHADPVPTPHGIAEMLASDRLLYRVYANNLGLEGHVWVAGWGSAAAVRGYHHPDVCWSGRGFDQTTKGGVKLPVDGGGEIPVVTRIFHRGAEEQFVVYWTQTGRRVWGEEEERAYFAETFGWRIFGRSRAVDAAGGGSEPRLMVLVGTLTGGETGRRETLGLAGAVAGAVYRACGWADPRRPAGP